MHLLSLSQLSVDPVSPVELIEIAAAAGFGAVGLRLIAAAGTASPGAPPLSAFPVRAVKQALRATGVRVLLGTSLWITAETDPAACAPAMDIAAELDAEYLMAVGNDPDAERLATNFASICDMAAARRLKIALEFLPYCVIRSLQQAVTFLQEHGRGNAGVVIDALHLRRSGGSPAEVAAVPPELIAFAQICDAPLAAPPFDQLRAEARTHRLYPGEGGLWLGDLLESLPDDLALDIEVPNASHSALPRIDIARRAASSMAALLAAATRSAPPMPRI